MEPLTGLDSSSWLPDLPPNIKLGWKCLTLSNTQVYYETATNNGIKSTGHSCLKTWKGPRIYIVGRCKI